MTTANIHDAKTNLSKYLTMAQNGETIIICKRNIPIAQLTACKPKTKERKLGMFKGEIEIPDSFFDPLPEDILEAFNNPK